MSENRKVMSQWDREKDRENNPKRIDRKTHEKYASALLKILLCLGSHLILFFNVRKSLHYLGFDVS